MSLSKYFVEETVKPTVRTVIKRDGTEQLFLEDKIKNWAKYAVRFKADWLDIYTTTLSRLPMKVSTEEIHNVMIQACLDKESINYSRVAARLLYAELRHNMAAIGVSDRGSFRKIYKTMVEKGLWTEVPPYTAEMEVHYNALYPIRLEYWQVRQWMDKYSLQLDGKPIETPHSAALALGYALFGVNDEGYSFARAVIEGKLNLPTPVLNGVRNGDYDTISCSVVEGGDSVDSIGAAVHLAYKMTAKKSGIGIMMNTRSIGDDVKGGRVSHLGKLPIYETIDKAVKMFTQVSRGGAATVSFSVYDPEVMEIIMVKSQRTPENKRIDKLDYSMVYDNYFLNAVIEDEDIQTVSAIGTKGPVYRARDILKAFLTVRKETGRLYCFNDTEANIHTPFLDWIKQSNLCMEIALPTQPFDDIQDIHTGEGEGEIAFCSLSAINVSKIKDYEYERIAYLAVKALTTLIYKAPCVSSKVKAKLMARRSLGIGITGLAGYLCHEKLSYSDTAHISKVAERHYYYLLKASQKLVEEGFVEPVKGIKTDWLPIDTRSVDHPLHMDWESLRGKPRGHSVLVAHMPTESSAVFSDATNGLYPVRSRVINKQSRKGSVQYIAPPVTELAWDIGNMTLANAYAAVQAFTDQGISADYYVGSGKVSMAQMMKEWVHQARLGLKSMYYLNTNDSNGGMFEEEACEGGCKL